jgi:hypothetical protein
LKSEYGRFEAEIPPSALQQARSGDAVVMDNRRTGLEQIPVAPI